MGSLNCHLRVYSQTDYAMAPMRMKEDQPGWKPVEIVNKVDALINEFARILTQMQLLIGLVPNSL